MPKRKQEVAEFNQEFPTTLDWCVNLSDVVQEHLIEGKKIPEEIPPNTAVAYSKGRHVGEINLKDGICITWGMGPNLPLANAMVRDFKIMFGVELVQIL